MGWKVLGPNEDVLQMTEGDFGVALKMSLIDYPISASDSVDFVVVDKIHGDEIVKKTYTSIENNAVNIELTAAESALLEPGEYVYRADWYQDGVFMDNLSRVGIFRVVVKA